MLTDEELWIKCQSNEPITAEDLGVKHDSYGDTYCHTSNCKNCKHKNDRCYCPPNRKCTAFEKEIHKARHTFEFETDEDWVPCRTACWANCPFSFMIKLGNSCICLDGDIQCPFLKYKMR